MGIVILMSAADEKQRLIHELEQAHPEWKAKGPRLQPIRSVLETMMEKVPTETYSHDPWWIMRVQPNSYKTAADSLRREGFESYSPTYKILGPQPLRLIPPKKRHQAGLYRREVRKYRFDGYYFIRRMWGHYDLNRLFDLDGCGSVVLSTGSIALVQDYDIELMRLAEMDGTMDEVQVETYRGYKVARLPDDGSDQWTGSSRIIGRLDDRGKTTLFVERMGRIARLISQADPAGVTLGAKL